MLHTFNVTSFRAQFPEFGNSTTYPDGTLSTYFTMASQYVTPVDSIFGLLSGDVLQLALDLMTAHLSKSFSLLNAGQTTVLVQGSTEGSVSVSLTPPPNKNAWQWWLGTTGYGMQLRALLEVQSSGGFYVGGLPERSAFRKVFGVW